jgi:tetratricopeptide (TPR) repeat protein
VKGTTGVAATILSGLTIVAVAQTVAAQTAPNSAPAKGAQKPTFDRLAQQAAAARKAGQLDDAIRLYRQALSLKPSWIEGQWGLGTLLYDLDQYAEARDAFRRVVAADAKNAVAHALLGLCEFQLKNYERSLEAIEKAKDLGIPSQEVASVTAYHSAILLNRFERFEAASDVLRDFALQGKDTQPVIEAFGLSLLRLPYLPSEAPIEKREMVLMAGRAAFQMAKGRRTAAGRLAFEELVSRYPAAPNVHYAFGTFLVLEDADAALVEFQRELRMSPNHYYAMLQIAFEQMKRSNYADALPLAEKAVELAPNLMAARNALGRALLENGQTERAIQELEAGVKLAPDSPQMQFALARAYTRAGRAEDAARARAEFGRLDRLARTARSGPQSVGGTGTAGDESEPQPQDPPLEQARPQSQ